MIPQATGPVSVGIADNNTQLVLPFSNLHLSQAEDKKRTQWIQEAAQGGMDMCGCDANRPENENTLLQNIVSRFPPYPNFEVSVMSIGSGGLLQDWILLKKMVEAGYKKVHLHFVDPNTRKETVENFTRFSSSLSAHVTISHSSCFVEELPMHYRFHCIHAMDFERLGHPYGGAFNGWMALDQATRLLDDKGILFSSADKRRYLFDAAVREWDIPCNSLDGSAYVRCEAGADVAFACTNLSHFWQSTFYSLAALTKMKAKTIHVEVLKSDEEHLVVERISKIQQLCQRILSPKKLTQIEISLQKNLTYDILTLADQFIDEDVLNRHFPSVKPGGIMIISPEDCWKKIDVFIGNYGENFRLKSNLQKRVKESYQKVVAHATALANARAIQLRIL